MKTESSTQAELFYRIVSRAALPARMRGTFTFQEAYILCVEWNSQHNVRDMAQPEPVEAA
jgi:hypothetical protein